MELSQQQDRDGPPCIIGWPLTTAFHRFRRHVAALAVFYAHPKARLILIGFAIVTVIATMTTGEHYMIDLLAAVPLVAFCVWSSRPVRIDSRLKQLRMAK
jgi:hypothetical protein